MIVCVSATILLALVTESPIYLLRQKREEVRDLILSLDCSGILVEEQLLFSNF